RGPRTPLLLRLPRRSARRRPRGRGKGRRTPRGSTPARDRTRTPRPRVARGEPLPFADPCPVTPCADPGIGADSAHRPSYPAGRIQTMITRHPWGGLALPDLELPHDVVILGVPFDGATCWRAGA